jgi:hypothetical protein
MPHAILFAWFLASISRWNSGSALAFS